MMGVGGVVLGLSLIGIAIGLDTQGSLDGAIFAILLFVWAIYGLIVLIGGLVLYSVGRHLTEKWAVLPDTADPSGQPLP